MKRLPQVVLYGVYTEYLDKILDVLLLKRRILEIVNWFITDCILGSFLKTNNKIKCFLKKSNLFIFTYSIFSTKINLI